MFKAGDRVRVIKGPYENREARVIRPNNWGPVGIKFDTTSDPFTYWHDNDKLELISVSHSVSVPNSVSVSVPGENSVSFSVPARSNVNVREVAGRVVITAEWE